MDLCESELPDPGSPCCALVQEGWEAAGVSTRAPTPADGNRDPDAE